MVEQVIQSLITNKHGTYVDCTFGAGGHSLAILEALGLKGRLTCLDKDVTSNDIARKIRSNDKRMSFIHDSFKNLKEHFELKSLDGVLLDLGISSNQLDDPKRGFSFQKLGPLDMRMDRSNKLSAEIWINNSSRKEIERVLRELGQEKKSKKIAEKICQRRQKKAIKTTKDLTDIVLSCKKRKSKKHPATDTFRAIRMIVNNELGELVEALEVVGKVLKKGGRLVVISFNSLEDRIVKRFIKGMGSSNKDLLFNLVGGKPLKPELKELKRNPRSRSAILRVAEKVVE